MTVAELIALLQQLPPDAEVESFGGDTAGWVPVERLEGPDPDDGHVEIW